MKLSQSEKRRLCRTFVEVFNRCNEPDDMLCEFEEKTPKAILKKLNNGGDVDDVGSPTYIYDRHADKLIKKVYREFPKFIKKCIMESQDV